MGRVTGSLPKAASARQLFEQEKRERHDKYLELKYEADIPALHDTPFRNRVNNIWRDKYNALCALMFERQGAMVGIIGPRGTGKTQMGVDAAQLWMYKAQRRARYIRAFDLFAAIKATYNGGDQAAVSVLKTVPMLVIDEMQVRSDSEWENATLTNILDRRYASKLITLLIANLTHDEFIRNVGASVYSRIIETGKIIETKWESFR